jgi:hypothetical protein
MNSDAPDAHFDYLSLFGGSKAKKVGNPKPIVKTVKSRKKKQPSTMT